MFASLLPFISARLETFANGFMLYQTHSFCRIFVFFSCQHICTDFKSTYSVLFVRRFIFIFFFSLLESNSWEDFLCVHVSLFIVNGITTQPFYIYDIAQRVCNNLKIYISNGPNGCVLFKWHKYRHSVSEKKNNRRNDRPSDHVQFLSFYHRRLQPAKISHKYVWDESKKARNRMRNEYLFVCSILWARKFCSKCIQFEYGIHYLALLCYYNRLE